MKLRTHHSPTPFPSLFALAGTLLLGACGGDGPPAQGEGAGGPRAEIGPSALDRPVVLDLWADGVPTFGIFVPDERTPAERSATGPEEGPRYTPEGAAELARSPILDFLFLNLEGGYDAGAVEAMAEGILGSGVDAPPALLVRIPSMEEAGEETTRERILEILDLGAHGVVIPHVRTPEEARIVVGFFREAGADVWAPGNRSGSAITMLMVEDPEAVERADEFADIPGYSILSCGIGSLTGALGGDREAGEAGCLRVLGEATRAGLPSMMTANSQNVGDRLDQGYLAILTAGPDAEEVIRQGRGLAGRD